MAGTLLGVSASDATHSTSTGVGSATRCWWGCGPGWRLPRGPRRIFDAVLAAVAGQDLCRDPGGRFVIARRVAKDRVISTVDPEARHGHKSTARRFDGYKGHAAVDPDSELGHRHRSHTGQHRRRPTRPRTHQRPPPHRHRRERRHRRGRRHRRWHRRGRRHRRRHRRGCW